AAGAPRDRPGPLLTPAPPRHCHYSLTTGPVGEGAVVVVIPANRDLNRTLTGRAGGWGGWAVGAGRRLGRAAQPSGSQSSCTSQRPSSSCGRLPPSESVWPCGQGMATGSPDQLK